MPRRDKSSGLLRLTRKRRKRLGRLVRSREAKLGKNNDKE